jgi:cytoskeletal protein CcmA (bactofilin family)
MKRNAGIVASLFVLAALIALAGAPAIAADATAAADTSDALGSITIGHTLKVTQAAQYAVPAGETQVRDLYLWAQHLNIEGTLDGDIIGWFQSGDIKGTVTQDLNVFAQQLTIDGVVGDDVRAFAQSITINGRVGGDVLAAGANVYLTKGSVIDGDLLVGAGTVTLDGQVKGDIKIATGAFTMDGTVGGDADVNADGGFTLGENARFGGDLTYKAPKEIAFGKGVVLGEVTFHPKEPEAAAKFRFPKALKVVFRIFALIGAIVAGSIIFALTKDHARRTSETIRRKPLKSLGIGFIAFICTPVIILICFVLLVTIPLGGVLSLGYLAALYLAKLYVAAWLGNLILRRGGREDASPIPGMLLGLPILYALTAIPVLGTLLMFVIVFFGLGALLQRRETRLNGAFEPRPVETDALPNTFPGAPAKE